MTLIQPESPQVWIDLGATYVNFGSWDKALAAYTDALELGPDCIDAHLGTARVLIKMQPTAAARGHVEQALGEC